MAEAQAQYPQTCTSNWCIVDIPDTPPTTYVMNNQWNKRGAQGSQSVTVYGSNSPGRLVNHLGLEAQAGVDRHHVSVGDHGLALGLALRSDPDRIPRCGLVG